MKKLTALVLALVLVLTASVSLAETFIMGIDPEYDPFTYMGDQGDYIGFDVEVCKAACEVAGLDMEIFPVVWDQKLIQLDAMECDCVWSGMTLTSSMAEAGYVLSKPYYQSTQVILTKENSGITTAADLAGKVVAVQLGTSGEELLNTDLADWSATFAQLITCESFLVANTELAGGAVDAVFIDIPVALKFKNENEGFVIIDENLGAEDYGIAFRKSDAALCAKIEDAVAQLVANGTYAEIAAKYYPEIVTEKLYFLAAAE